MKHRRLSVFLCFLAVFALLLTFSACGTSETSDRAESPSANPTVKKSADAGDSDVPEGGASGRKVIYYVDLTLESKEYDAATDSLKNLASSLGGYLQSSEENGTRYAAEDSARSAHYVFRIPTEKYQEFTEKTGEFCNIVSSSLTSDDITDSYYDTAARLDACRAQETRLLQMIEQCGTLNELLTLEDKLTEVRYKIEQLEGTIGTYDKNVAYSTITVSLSEVKEYTDPGKAYGEQFGEALKTGWKVFGKILRGLGIALAFLLPWAAVAGIVVLIVCLPRRKKKRDPDSPDKKSKESKES